ncbi:hypothetical protein GCM10010495_40200 [Kitasatospora herbaricolor]|uniref:hypothetical protein n=1 Tax=Kitasatospora herbaricolor TaxID=68217 RepID=UPI00174A39B5|nr:hypothetical protein [Kitasatospora herbaricolor]MDQ0313158.1 hypothetical protein [Kitasatospora herbaricolor]GGV20772.1 hypothetical protein GCM10010495_40200 [Kitasatospora herbaricolor]
MTLNRRPLGQPFSEPASDDSAPVVRTGPLPVATVPEFRRPPGTDEPAPAATWRPLGARDLLPFSDTGRPAGA